MGLLSTEVEVTLVGKNIPYYENLGYEIPRIESKYGFCVPRNTKINVKIDDVSYGSGVKVNVNCDLCGKEYQEKYLALRKYCRQDTWAMVEILWNLKKKADF